MLRKVAAWKNELLRTVAAAACVWAYCPENVVVAAPAQRNGPSGLAAPIGGCNRPGDGRYAFVMSRVCGAAPVAVASAPNAAGAAAAGCGRCHDHREPVMGPSSSQIVQKLGGYHAAIRVNMQKEGRVRGHFGAKISCENRDHAAPKRHARCYLHVYGWIAIQPGRGRRVDADPFLFRCCCT